MPNREKYTPVLDEETRTKGHTKNHLKAKDTLTQAQTNFVEAVLAGYSPKVCLAKANYKSRSLPTYNSLIATPKIQNAIEEGRRAAAKRNAVTQDEIIGNLRSIFDNAMAAGSFGPATAATKLLGEYLGMFDKSQPRSATAIFSTPTDGPLPDKDRERLEKVANLSPATPTKGQA